MVDSKQRRFDLGYSDSRKTIVMKASVLGGLTKEGNSFVFRAQNFLPFRDDSKFRCQLHLRFDASRENHLEQVLRDSYLEIDRSIFRLRFDEGVLTIECPLATQVFVVRSLGANPVSFVEESNLRLSPRNSELPENRLSLMQLVGRSMKMQYWIAQHGPPSMFVPDRHEQFESSAVVSGGRPESNRRFF
jgi:hypothetical protein